MSSPVRPASCSRCSKPCWRRRSRFAKQALARCGWSMVTVIGPRRCTVICRRPMSSNGAAEHCIAPRLTSRWCARSDPVSLSMSPDMLKEKAYLEGDPLPVSVVKIAGIRTLVTVPMLKDGEAIGVITIYRKEVHAFHRQADRTCEQFRQAGRHRHREHAAAQRAAPAHGRSDRGAGAADGDVGSAEESSLVRPASLSRCSSHAGERDPDLRRQVRHSVPVRRRCLSRRRVHNVPQALPIFARNPWSTARQSGESDSIASLTPNRLSTFADLRD